MNYHELKYILCIAKYQNLTKASTGALYFPANPDQASSRNMDEKWGPS